MSAVQTGSYARPGTGQVKPVAPRMLLLMRHAKSAWPDVPDRERPLAARGRRDAPLMGRWLRSACCIPDRVVCSTAVRASQTWQLAAPALEANPETVFDDRVYAASAAQLLELVAGTPGGVGALLIVGHDPAVPELARALAAGAPESSARLPGAGDPAASSRIRGKFPTAAVAAFGCDGDWDVFAPGRAWLSCFAVPRELRARNWPAGEP